MVKKVLVYWRDIPAQVIVQRGRERHKVLLSSRFQKAIDRAAMRAGKGSTDAYLAEWRRVASRIVSDDDLRELADREVQQFEKNFPDDHLLQLIRDHGTEK
jgi:hypothetical protein